MTTINIKDVPLNYSESGNSNNHTIVFAHPLLWGAEVTKKMLTQQLRELEQDEIIERKIYHQVPPKVEYSLSEYGKSLKPALELMAVWGSEHRLKYGRDK